MGAGEGCSLESTGHVNLTIFLSSLTVKSVRVFIYQLSQYIFSLNMLYHIAGIKFYILNNALSLGP